MKADEKVITTTVNNGQQQSSQAAAAAAGILQQQQQQQQQQYNINSNHRESQSGNLNNNNNRNRTHSTTKTYDLGKVLGNGSFGVVSEATCLMTGDRVAIKKVLQDPRYKNRELDIMKQLVHPNVVTLRDYFYSEGYSDDPKHENEIQRFLSVVMEFVPETVYKVLKSFTKNQCYMPMVLIKVYTYQMLRSVGYLHSLGICHRDIKPQNLLVDVRSHTLKLCDFGSAKRLLTTESSVSYICSRFYRAPELMLGATQYTCAIDTWSTGCVIGELLIGRPIFAGETSVDQLVKIMKVLGTPNREQVTSMNKQYADFKFPELKPQDFRTIIPNFDHRIPESAYDLLQSLLKLVPSERLTPYESLAHPFFDQLREPGCQLPGANELPELFNFSDHELAQMSPSARAKIIPCWFSNSPPPLATNIISPMSPEYLNPSFSVEGGQAAAAVAISSSASSTSASKFHQHHQQQQQQQQQSSSLASQNNNMHILQQQVRARNSSEN